MEFVKIRHPKIETLGECPLSALPHWEGYGWRRVNEPPAVPTVVPDIEPEPETESVVEPVVPQASPRASRRVATTEE